MTKLSTNGRRAENWGGARVGAGRPRTETLAADELRLLLGLLAGSPYAAEYADTLAKLNRMLDKAEAGR